jgi:predicted phage terminase large subunit-like protein
MLDAEQLRQQIEKALVERSLHAFVKAAWHIVEPEIEYKDNWHIRAICSHLEAVARGDITQLIINVPPATMKSLICCVFFPCWVWTTAPSSRFIFASYSDSLTMRDSVKCRNIITGEWYQSQWPMELRGDQNTKGMFENTQGGWRMATSVGGRATGLHPTFLICDDPNNAKDAESEAERKSVNDWWDGAITTRGITRNVRQVVVQQRLNVQDLTGHLLEKGTFEHICLPMRYEADRMKPTSLGWTDPRKEDGELLWPALLPEPLVDKLEKSMGIYFAAGQLQQRPSPRGGGMFKRAWFSSILPIRPLDIVDEVRYWDKAGTAGGDGARTAGVRIGRRANGRFIILNVIKGRWGATEREAVIKQTAEMDGRHVTVWVEQEGGSGGKESAESTVINLAGYSCKIERVTGSKEVRAEPFAAQCSVQNVDLLLGDWNEEFIGEAEQFPAGALKDQIDAAGGGFNKLAAPTGAWDTARIQQLAAANGPATDTTQHPTDSDGLEFPTLETWN